METLGLIETWSKQIESGKVQSEKMGQQALDQLLAQINPNDAFKKRFTESYQNYLGKVSSPWTAKEIVAVWSEYYSPNFTEAELDKLIEFYTSDLGKKDVEVSNQTTVKFTEHFQNAMNPIHIKAVKEYVAEMKIIATECKCPRKQANNK
jgi:hypothetical protein